MITHSNHLYALFEPLLGVFERKRTPRKPSEAGLRRGDACKVIIFGLGRFGTAIGIRLDKLGIRVLGIDFNPFAVRRWRELGLSAEFGDTTDPEFVGALQLARAKWIVSTVPIHAMGLSEEDAGTTLIQLTRTSGLCGRITVTSHNARDTEDLLRSGQTLFSKHSRMRLTGPWIYSAALLQKSVRTSPQSRPKRGGYRERSNPNAREPLLKASR